MTSTLSHKQIVNVHHVAAASWIHRPHKDKSTGVFRSQGSLKSYDYRLFVENTWDLMPDLNFLDSPPWSPSEFSPTSCHTAPVLFFTESASHTYKGPTLPCLFHSPPHHAAELGWSSMGDLNVRNHIVGVLLIRGHVTHHRPRCACFTLVHIMVCKHKTVHKCLSDSCYCQIPFRTI